MNDWFIVIGKDDGKYYYATRFGEDAIIVAKAKTFLGFPYSWEDGSGIMYTDKEFRSKFTEAP